MSKQQVPAGQSYDNIKNPLLKEMAIQADRNDAQWKVAEQLGITREKLDLNHPELVVEQEKLDHVMKSSLKKSAVITAASGIAGAAIPLALHKHIPTKRWVKGVIAVFSAAAGATAGAYGSFKGYSKPVARVINEAIRMENDALSQEIGAHMKQEAPVVPTQSSATDLVEKRDGSFTAQVGKDAEKAKTITISIT